MSFEINVQDFIDEAEEQIRVLNDGLLTLEKNKDDQEIINEEYEQKIETLFIEADT